MSTMISGVHDALVAARAPEDKARAAAIAVSEEQPATRKDTAEIKAELKVIKWTLGVVIVVTVIPALRSLFLP